MASNLLRFPLQKTTIFSNLSPSSPPLPRTLFPSLQFPFHQRKIQLNFSFSYQNLIHKSQIPSLSIHSSLSANSYDPPTTKEEAILQAKTCLSITLEKPLNNPRLSAGKLKKQKQPKLRVEIPVSNDSDESLTQLAFDIFQDLPVRRKDSPINLVLLWPNPTLTDLASTTFLKSHPSNQTVQNLDISSVSNTDSYNKVLNSADVAVFLAPDKTELELIKRISDGVYPKPVVVFNPKWGFEEESGFGELSGFVGSFEVVYSFMGMEVRGLLSKKKAVVFRNAKDGVLSGEKWLVLVEEEEGKLKVVTKYKKRPTIGEIENVLYNLMAVNSPVTKSVKFFRDLVSNVTGKK
ncbi:hypothetical protein MKW98_015524 [Papaver atlanticum]|uniref:DUF1995 domain-containing protein n=1 Tax=Papaver atlanticum TaxID=357466 RepID=A0AAD4X7P2_9MAGN|nr:hypothetical protein MKW98_015524 [Papaver atlanticum]